jgi:hypothetical protein
VESNELIRFYGQVTQDFDWVDLMISILREEMYYVIIMSINSNHNWRLRRQVMFSSLPAVVWIDRGTAHLVGSHIQILPTVLLAGKKRNATDLHSLWRHQLWWTWQGCSPICRWCGFVWNLGAPSKIAISRYLSSIFSRTHVLLWDWQFLSGELGSAWTVNGSTFTTNQGTNPNAASQMMQKTVSAQWLWILVWSCHSGNPCSGY